MNRTVVLLIIVTIGCITQEPPHVERPLQFEEYEPHDTELTVNQGETIEFSCTISGPDTDELEYAWYTNGEKVSDTYWYDFTMPAGTYTVVVDVSDGATVISIQWNVTVAGSPDFTRIMDRLESVRGLIFLEEVNKIVIDRDQMRQNFVTDLQEEGEDIEVEKALYVALHIMDPETDLYQTYVDLLSSQVASYYDADNHIFYEVVDPDHPVVFREFIAAHEFIHALQDQYAYLDHEFENDDEHLAFLCVVEGDAVFHQYMYLDTMTSSERQDLFAFAATLDIPVVNQFLENVLMLRYDLGLEFVAQMSFSGVDVTSGVDALYEKLPISTEQVMHPEKYMSYELPLPVTLPSLPGWEILTDDVFGEAVLGTILKEYIDAERAVTAAQGWGGDRYGYYQKGEEYVLIVNTFWDTESDAAEFYRAYYDYTLSWSSRNVEKISEFIYQTPTGYMALIQKGTQVVIVESASLDPVVSAVSVMGFCYWI
jgi:hypothetical protein